MLVMRPSEVGFGARTLGDVERVSVDSVGEDMAQGWGNEGPNLVFADAVRRSTLVRVVQTLSAQTDLDALTLGEQQQLRVRFVGGGDADEKELRVTCVVQSVVHSFAASGARRETRLIGVSADGGNDPVTVIEGGVS